MVHRLRLRRISEETRRSDLALSRKVTQHDAEASPPSSFNTIEPFNSRSPSLAGIEVEPFNPCTYIQPHLRKRNFDTAAETDSEISAVPAPTINGPEAAAALLKTYSSSSANTLPGKPTVPTRTTSKTSLPRRKRHEELVAFHRNSCQIFSSLDGAMAELRSSSTSSSSSSLASPSSTSSPTSGSSTRETSIDYGHSSPLLGPTTTDQDGLRSLSQRAAHKRPLLHRSKGVPNPPTGSRSHIIITKEVDVSYSTTREERTHTSTPPHSVPKSSQVTTTPLLSSSNNHKRLPTYSNRDPTTTEPIHWTSPETRQREYARIDAAHSGFRLFLRRVFPKSCCERLGGGRKDFWDRRASAEVSECGSVRRFRIGGGGNGDREKDVLQCRYDEKKQRRNSSEINVRINEVEEKENRPSLRRILTCQT